MGQHSKQLMNIDTMEIPVTKADGKHRSPTTPRKKSPIYKHLAGYLLVSAATMALSWWWHIEPPHGAYNPDVRTVTVIPPTTTTVTTQPEVPLPGPESPTRAPKTTAHTTTPHKVTVRSLKPPVAAPRQEPTQPPEPQPAAILTFCNTPEDCQNYVASRLDAPSASCLDNIITKESGWNVSATNPSSGAYGLPQSLPAGKMAAAGADWQTNGVTQINWMIQYVHDTYGSACAAWSYWQAHSSY